ncbi:hypothetical protein [Aggregatilinea lenta]|uniref:hypothetical protein n=1 Tax=Aggregatilinea lenta TaxID=913108 RepID=UPI000E5A8369|nr:hypothetical protein [Aggregatilinea lenta]
MSCDLFYEILLNGPDRDVAAQELTHWLRNDDSEDVEEYRDVNSVCLAAKDGTHSVGDTFHWRLTDVARAITQPLDVEGTITFEGCVNYTAFCGKNIEPRLAREHFHEMFQHVRYLTEADRAEMIEILTRQGADDVQRD